MKVNTPVTFSHVRGVAIISVSGKFFMAFKRGAPSGLLTRNNNAKHGACRVSVIALLLVSVCAPLVIITSRTTKLFSAGIESIQISQSLKPCGRSFFDDLSGRLITLS